MNPSGTTNNGSSSSGGGQNSSAHNGHGRYRHDPRNYAPVYQRAANVPSRDGNTAVLTGMNQNYQPRRGSNTNTPGTINNPEFVPNSYTSQYILVPNSGVIGGSQQVPSFIPGQTDQMNQYQYFPPGVYPGMASTMVSNGYPSWSYMVNYDMQDKQNQTDNSGMYYPMNYVPAGLDGAGTAPYTFGPILGALPMPGALPALQMMKTTNGYVVQDMEVLTQQEPAIPRAVPAMWTNPSEMTLAKCLENREGITNVYIRGFLPETTDEMLHSYAARFGGIERCKAIVDLETSLCKGFGFVQYYTYEACENAVRGFFYLGYQASFAQKSRNSRLKDLEDRTSTNIYCTNIPIDWTEADLRRHFEPYHVVSEKISRDEKTGVSKEVGFARFETREIAETVLNEFHNAPSAGDVKLLLRFADTKAQKVLKQQSNERRAYRAGEYNYSVEVVQASATPSPTLQRLQQHARHLTPNSAASFGSPAGTGPEWTPATSLSPYVSAHSPINSRTFVYINRYIPKHVPGNVRQDSLSSRSLNALENATAHHRPILGRRSLTDISGVSSKTARAPSVGHEPRSYMSSPRKENIKAGSMSPVPSRMEFVIPSPRSCT
ncbi:Nucleotide-binding alpha-beta plait [Penicillium longicatenatum]|uniref:Nucleotide-binding alpha-beta plait n=1 Tax=Penicillium longicatenatum TaxID=1561947 RepID=UPI002548D470|nr:Nucleotide-binding alpha-beta plait [Penicillium longicatenatum]KAJ5643475.1 Nucleotide-binding alpha-beta plait [Penicillium longicatenatum]